MKSGIRVLFINHSVRWGGPGKSLFYILKYIDKAKIMPLVLIPKEEVFSERLREEGIEAQIIVEKKFPENLLRPRFSLSDTNSGTWLRRVSTILSVTLNVFDLFLLFLGSPFWLRKRKVGVIYCNGTVAKIVGAVIGTFNLFPVIWHVRNIQQTKALRFTMNFLSLSPAVKKIICVSNATAGQFRFASGKISVIYNGIDTDEFNPQKTAGLLKVEYSLPEGTVVVGSTGRVVPRKGYEHFIQAALTVRNKLGAGEGGKVKFVLVGDTPYYFRDNHLNYLKSLVKELNLEDMFILAGHKDDVKPYLRDFDVFVIPSNYPDPFPRVVIEAMSFAIPVVGYGIGGIQEAIEHGVTGFLNEPGNIEQMADSIISLIGDRSLRLSMGLAGRERVIKNFSAEAKTKEVEEKILEVRSQKSGVIFSSGFCLLTSVFFFIFSSP
ncbi:MAG TPA: glycosyltransferase family 4 protein [Thermodesulfobacteriota bacterium]|nr:glycosyltransferase family 4 protein [Thermodesulfobacteriota bacterium]